MAVLETPKPWWKRIFSGLIIKNNTSVQWFAIRISVKRVEDNIERMNEVCIGVAKKMNFRLLRLNGESDHVHLLIEYPPKLSISQIVNSLKGVSSRMLRKEFDLAPHKEHLWSPSYFCVSCGGAPIAKIKQYIDGQQSP